jgi:isochorismate pyruvate lyase
MKKQIIAISGEAFAADLAIEQYFLQQTGKAKPKICLLPTASGDAQETISAFHQAFHSLGARTACLSLFRPQTNNFQEFLGLHDGIFISDGNAAALNAMWQAFGIGKALKACLDSGVVIAASDASAGALFDGLGFLSGRFCNRYENHQTEFDIETGEYLALASGSAAHFIDGKLSQLLATNACKVPPIAARSDKVKHLTAVNHRNYATERAFTGARWESEISYCRVLRKGNQVFVTGTAAVDEDGKVYAPFEYYKQTRRCLEIIAENLDKIGATMKNITRTRMFVTNIAEWREYGKAHKEFFAESPPATTMVEVSSLISPGMVIEIEADALV